MAGAKTVGAKPAAKNSPKAGAKSAAAKVTPVVEERILFARPWAVGTLPTGASLTGALPQDPFRFCADFS